MNSHVVLLYLGRALVSRTEIVDSIVIHFNRHSTNNHPPQAFLASHFISYLSPRQNKIRSVVFPPRKLLEEPCSYILICVTMTHIENLNARANMIPAEQY